MNIKEGLKFTGEIAAQVHKQTKPHLKAWNRLLRFCESLGLITRGQMQKYYALGELQREQIKTNLITTAGFSVLAQILMGEYGDTGEITHMALGDGVGTPAVGDTALFNEVYRNATASNTTSANVGIATAFFTEIEVDGTFTEFGNFIDGTEMWSHLNVPWVKSDEETLTVQCKYTLTNA